MTRRDFINFEAHVLGAFICRDIDCSINGLGREYCGLCSRTFNRGCRSTHNPR